MPYHNKWIVSCSIVLSEKLVLHLGEHRDWETKVMNLVV